MSDIRPVREPAERSCIYCGLPSGRYDEHAACVTAALLVADLESDTAGQERDGELVQADALLSRERDKLRMEGGRHAD
jgi:hypothetical protein